jgi:N-acetylneuraminic acid mutarotase
MYVFGGRNGVDMTAGSMDDLHAFDSATATWQLVAPAPGSAVPPARSYHTMTAAGGKLYVFGGCGASGRLNDLWRWVWRCTQRASCMQLEGLRPCAATRGVGR